MAAKHLITLLLFVSLCSHAQQLPDAPQPKSESNTPLPNKAKSKPKPFFDTQTSLELAALAATIPLDALSTFTVLNEGYGEFNPIARPFVGHRLTSALFFGTSYAFTGGLAYLANRMNHRRIKHTILLVAIGIEVGSAVNNWTACKPVPNNCDFQNPTGCRQIKSFCGVFKY